MDNNSEKISAIIGSEEELEEIINQMIAESVARSDISVQGTPEQLKDKYGVCFIPPEKIQDSRHPPVKEPFLKDDFGWVVAFSFTLPLIIRLVIGIFIIGDVRSNNDVMLYGLIGALVGTVIGLILSGLVKKTYEKRVLKQENEGGFVLWVTTHSQKQHDQVVRILERYHPKNIKDE